jgi:hypothetical protein
LNRLFGMKRHSLLSPCQYQIIDISRDCFDFVLSFLTQRHHVRYVTPAATLQPTTALSACRVRPLTSASSVHQHPFPSHLHVCHSLLPFVTLRPPTLFSSNVNKLLLKSHVCSCGLCLLVWSLSLCG